jgi:adenine-specific DNA-methyltransferase
MPRVKAAITGLTPEGAPIAGDYKFTNEFPMAKGFDENAIFLKLNYLEKNSVARGKAFEAIAPLLWLKAGAKGPQITKVKKPFAAPKGASYAVLFDAAQAAGFIEALRDREDIEHAYIVTNSMAEYQQVIVEFSTTVETTMLYEDYISNFELNLGRLL